MILKTLKQILNQVFANTKIEKYAKYQAAPSVYLTAAT